MPVFPGCHNFVCLYQGEVRLLRLIRFATPAGVTYRNILSFAASFSP